MTVAERLKKAREARGLGQKELSTNAGVSNAYVGMVERVLEVDAPPHTQIRNPGVEQLQKLALALDVPEEWLVLGIGPDPFDGAPDSSSRHRVKAARRAS